MTKDDKAAGLRDSKDFLRYDSRDTRLDRNLAAIFTCANVIMLVPSNRTPQKRSEAEEGGGAFS